PPHTVFLLVQVQLQPGCLFACQTAGEMAQHKRLQSGADLELVGNLVNRKIADDNALLRGNGQKSFRLQAPHRCADWCLAHGKLAGDLAFREERTRRECAAEDLSFQFDIGAVLEETPRRRASGAGYQRHVSTVVYFRAHGGSVEKKETRQLK